MSYYVRLHKLPTSLPALPETIVIQEEEGVVSIGRNPENTISCEDKTISKKHCSLELRPCVTQLAAQALQNGKQASIKKVLFVQDSSTFGTWVNDVKLQKSGSCIPNGAYFSLRKPKDGILGDYTVEYFTGCAPTGDEILLDQMTRAPIGQVVLPAPVASQMGTLNQQGSAPGMGGPPMQMTGMPPSAPGMQPGMQPPAPGMQPPAPAASPFANGLPQQSPGLVPASGNLMPLNLVPANVSLMGNNLEPAASAAVPAPNPNLNPLEIWIPANMAGFVVGKGGATISGICEASGAKLEISKDRNNIREGMKQVNVIEGTPDQIAVAKKMICEIVDAEINSKKGPKGKGKKGEDKGGFGKYGVDKGFPGDKGFDKGGKGFHDKGFHDKGFHGFPGDKGFHGEKGFNGKGSMEERILPREGAEILIAPADVIGFAVGRGNENITRIQTDTATTIEIGLSPDPNSDPSMRAVQISGEAAAVSRAKTIVTELLQDAQAKKQAQPQIQGKVRFEKEVPTEMVGLLIGHKGDTIRKLQSESGCRVEIDKSRGQPGVTQVVVFEGSQEAINIAVAKVDEVITPSEAPKQQHPEHMRNLGIVGSNNEISQDEGGLFRCHFPVDQAGIPKIVGPNGTTIRRLGEESETNISIVRENDTADHICIIRGTTTEQVSRGRELVTNILNGDDNSGKGKGKNKGKGGKKGGKEGENPNNMPLGQTASKGKGKYNNYTEETRKIYIDEIPFNRREAMPAPEEKEVFVSGIRTDKGEADLWKALCALGADGVGEILLLKDADNSDMSKGMAYVLFNTQQHAMIAVQKLSQRPLPPECQDIATDQLLCQWSESERVLGGKEGAYGEEFLGKLMGKKAVRMQEMQQQTGCNRAMLTGKGMKGYGTTDDDSRLHLVLCCQPGTGLDIEKLARPIWIEQLNHAYQDHRNWGAQKGAAPLGGVFIPPAAGVAPPGAAPPGMPPMGIPGMPPPGAPGGPPIGAPPPIGGGRLPGPQHSITYTLQPPHGGPVQQMVVTINGAAPPPNAQIPLPPDLPAGTTVLSAVVGPAVAPQFPPGLLQPGGGPGEGFVVPGGGAAVPAAAAPAPPIKIPLVMKRVEPAVVENGVEIRPARQFCEAVALVGSELRWQPWCQTVGGEDWKSYPLRWGKESQLFVIVQHRKTGQIKLCVVEESKPMDEWKTVVAPPVELFSAEGCKFRPFNIDGKSYLICLDRVNRKLLVYKIRDPNEAWVTMYEQNLNDPSNEKSMPFSHNAKLTVFYCPESRNPYVVVHDQIDGYYAQPQLFRIRDAAQAWEKVEIRLPLPQTKFRLWPVYMRTNSGEKDPSEPDNPQLCEEVKIEVFLFAIDVEQRELRIIYIPREGATHDWIIQGRKSFAGDTRFSILYISGKPEPMLMSLSATTSTACLFKIHLHKILPPLGASARDLRAPEGVILEELFRRDIGDLLTQHPAMMDSTTSSGGVGEAGADSKDTSSAPLKAKMHLIPVDTSADLACSAAHPWITSIIKRSTLPNLQNTSNLIVRDSGDTVLKGPFDMGSDEESSSKRRKRDAMNGPFDSSPFDEGNSSPQTSAGRKKKKSDDPAASPFEDDELENPSGSPQENPFDDGFWHIGQHVEGNWRKKGHWWVGKIIAVRPGIVEYKKDPFGNIEVDLAGQPIPEEGGREKGRTYDIEYENAGGAPFLEENVAHSSIRELPLKFATTEKWKGAKEILLVDTHMVGLVIGAKGATIKDLEKEMRVKICVGKDSADVPEDELKEGQDRDAKRCITILADDANNCSTCRDRITRIIADAVKKTELEKKWKEEIEKERVARKEEWGGKKNWNSWGNNNWNNNWNDSWGNKKNYRKDSRGRDDDKENRRDDKENRRETNRGRENINDSRDDRRDDRKDDRRDHRKEDRRDDRRDDKKGDRRGDRRDDRKNDKDRDDKSPGRDDKKRDDRDDRVGRRGYGRGEETRKTIVLEERRDTRNSENRRSRDRKEKRRKDDAKDDKKSKIEGKDAKRRKRADSRS